MPESSSVIGQIQGSCKREICTPKCIGTRRQDRVLLLPPVYYYPRATKKLSVRDDDPLTKTWLRTFLMGGYHCAISITLAEASACSNRKLVTHSPSVLTMLQANSIGRIGSIGCDGAGWLIGTRVDRCEPRRLGALHGQPRKCQCKQAGKPASKTWAV